METASYLYESKILEIYDFLKIYDCPIFPPSSPYAFLDPEISVLRDPSIPFERASTILRADKIKAGKQGRWNGGKRAKLWWRPCESDFISRRRLQHCKLCVFTPARQNSSYVHTYVPYACTTRDGVGVEGGPHCSATSPSETTVYKPSRRKGEIPPCRPDAHPRWEGREEGVKKKGWKYRSEQTRLRSTRVKSLEIHTLTVYPTPHLYFEPSDRPTLNIFHPRQLLVQTFVRR